MVKTSIPGMRTAYHGALGLRERGGLRYPGGVVKHPFAVGIGVGAVGLIAWWKRHTIASWFAALKAKTLGASDGADAVVRRVMASGQPAIVVIASGYDGPRVQALVQALRSGAGGDQRTVIDTEGWPSAQAPAGG